jgi:tetratricopeptide (TPR) repeat protein
MPPPEHNLSPLEAEIYELMVVLNSHTDRFGPHDPQTLSVANKLAIAFLRCGEVDQAIGLLDRALDQPSSRGLEHPIHIDLLGTMVKIMFEQQYFEQASAIQREVLELRVRYSGAVHPTSIEAKVDLAAILFELGQNKEAALLEEEAFESARIHLGRSHSVTCVLAWNRVVSYERRGDLESARNVIAKELAWLLAEDPSCLMSELSAIRALLSKRLNWDAASAC